MTLAACIGFPMRCVMFSWNIMCSRCSSARLACSFWVASTTCQTCRKCRHKPFARAQYAVVSVANAGPIADVPDICTQE